MCYAMWINCSTQKDERAIAYTYIIINETTNKTQFVDANRLGCRKGKGRIGLSEKSALVVKK